MANLQNLTIKDLQRLVADLAKNSKSEEYSYKLIITNERDKISQIQSDSKDVKSRSFDTKDAAKPSSSSSITDSELIAKLLPDVAGLVGAYTTVIQSSADIRRLLLLDPSGRSAKQALKDQTGKDLKVEAVLQILDSKYDTQKEQYERYRDLVDLGLYYPAVKMFTENKYGFPVQNKNSIWENSHLQKVMEEVLVVTDNLFDMAVDRQDFRLAQKIGDITSVQSQSDPILYFNGRNIGGRGIIWWIQNGTTEQISFVISRVELYFETKPIDIEGFVNTFKKAEQIGKPDVAGSILYSFVKMYDDFGNGDIIENKDVIIGLVKYDLAGFFNDYYRQALNNGPSASFTEAIEYIKASTTLRRKARKMLLEYNEENPDDETFSEANINQYL